MVEITEGAYGAAVMQVARTDVAAAFGVLNTGGNVGGIIAQPIMGFLTNGGAWGVAFMSGTVFALIAAALWLVIDPERLAELESQPASVIRKAASA
jgi:nitrate/nitrite transporter NarK